jgi:hypothetical protein
MALRHDDQRTMPEDFGQRLAADAVPLLFVFLR